MEHICDCEGTGELPVLYREKNSSSDDAIEMLYQTCACCSCEAAFKNIEIKDINNKGQMKISKVKKYPFLGTYKGWKYDPRFLPIPERIDEPGCEDYSFAQRFMYIRAKWWDENRNKINAIIGKKSEEFFTKNTKESLMQFIESAKRKVYIEDLIKAAKND